jgi:hypothetical protein
VAKHGGIQADNSADAIPGPANRHRDHPPEPSQRPQTPRERVPADEMEHDIATVDQPEDLCWNIGDAVSRTASAPSSRTRHTY